MSLQTFCSKRAFFQTPQCDECAVRGPLRRTFQHMSVASSASKTASDDDSPVQKCISLTTASTFSLLHVMNKVLSSSPSVLSSLSSLAALTVLSACVGLHRLSKTMFTSTWPDLFGIFSNFFRLSFRRPGCPRLGGISPPRGGWGTSPHCLEVIP